MGHHKVGASHGCILLTHTHAREHTYIHPYSSTHTHWLIGMHEVSQNYTNYYSRILGNLKPASHQLGYDQFTQAGIIENAGANCS